MTVQRSNDADAREHRWKVMFCNQQKRPHVERVFNPSRKEPHWGRRKLARRDR
jgi:hypothetical protein